MYYTLALTFRQIIGVVCVRLHSTIAIGKKKKKADVGGFFVVVFFALIFNIQTAAVAGDM